VYVTFLYNYKLQSVKVQMNKSGVVGYDVLGVPFVLKDCSAFIFKVGQSKKKTSAGM